MISFKCIVVIFISLFAINSNANNCRVVFETEAYLNHDNVFERTLAFMGVQGNREHLQNSHAEYDGSAAIIYSARPLNQSQSTSRIIRTLGTSATISIDVLGLPALDSVISKSLPRISIKANAGSEEIYLNLSPLDHIYNSNSKHINELNEQQLFRYRSSTVTAYEGANILDFKYISIEPVDKKTVSFYRNPETQKIESARFERTTMDLEHNQILTTNIIFNVEN